MHAGDGWLDKGLSRRIYALLGAMVALLAIGFGPTVVSAGAALGPPPWNSGNGLCPASTGSPLGSDTGCEWGIDVTTVNGSGAGTTDVINQDADQGPYDNVEDVLVVVENDGTNPLSKLALGFEGSHAETFGFDGDGICSGLYITSPPCPFDTSPEATGYEGPGTTFTVGATTDFGTVNFSPALQPGQHTYFSLELSPNTILTDSNVNNFVTTVQSAPGQNPAQYIGVNQGVNVTDNATVVGPHGAAASGGDGSAAGSVVYKLYSDKLCQQPPVYTSVAKAVTAGIAAASDPIGASLPAGRYYWQVTYSGDGGSPTHNTESVSLCGNEVLAIGGSVVTTKLSSTLVAPGTPITDSAVVNGASPSGTATGSVTFTVNSDATCQKPVSGQSQTVALTSAAATTAPITLPAGTYYFQVSYSGDTKNAPGVSACGSEVLIVQSPPPPSSQFTSVGNPQVNTKNGQIVVIGQFPAPGTATANGIVTQGATLARVKQALAEAARKKKCKRGFVKKGRKCVNNAPVVYGTATLAIPGPGTYSIVISPTSRALKALKAGKKLNVVISTTFQNRAGGIPVTHLQSVFVKLKKPKKHGHHRRH